jgi:hypothetical protein
MIMRYRVLVMLAMLIVASAALGQITIHNTDYSGIGSHYTWGFATNATFDVGQSGTNQIWTFGDHTFGQTGQDDIISPSASPYGALFPTATQAIYRHDPSNPGQHYYEYDRIDQGGVYFLGAQEIGDPYVSPEPQLVNPLPVQYQSTWSGVTLDTLDATPGRVSVLVDSGIVSVDGWGTVQTPYATYPCLRVYGRDWQKSYLNGVVQDAWESGSLEWWNQAGNVVVRVSSSQGASNPNFTSGSLHMIDVPLAIDPARQYSVQYFSVGQNYPNPFNPTTTLPIMLEKNGLVTVDVFDALGRLSSHEVMPMNAGSQSIPIDGSGWASGNYFARVQAGKQRQTVRMQLVK